MPAGRENRTGKFLLFTGERRNGVGEGFAARARFGGRDRRKFIPTARISASAKACGA